MKVGDETDAEEKVEKARKVWGVFVDAVGKGTRIQGTSLNQEERLWIGVLGWESSEVSLDLCGGGGGGLPSCGDLHCKETIVR